MQNTFQTILATDGTSSYAILLYDHIQWFQADFRSGSASASGSGSGGGSSALMIRLIVYNRVLGLGYMSVIAS